MPSDFDRKAARGYANAVLRTCPGLVEQRLADDVLDALDQADAEIARLRGLLERARGLLVDLDMKTGASLGEEYPCPECGHFPHMGHRGGCELAALLDDLGGPNDR